MKRNEIIGLMMALAICGCQVQEEGELAPEGKVFTATMEAFVDDASGVETRTALDAGGSVLWKMGDQVSIFAGSTINEHYQVTDASDGKTAAALNRVESPGFVAGGDIDNNVAFYPYAEMAELAKNGSAYVIRDIALPATQTYAQASFGNGAFPMTAVTSSTRDYNLKFKNVLGGLKLQLKGTATIASISITGNNNEVLCGDAVVDVSTTSAPSISLTDASAKTVTLDCGNGVQLNETTATVFIIALPPMTMTGGFTITVTGTSGATMEIKTTKSQTITRSNLLSMPAVVVQLSDAQPNNEIWYTSTDGNIVEPAVTTGFGANIVSNTYENGKGVIRFDGPVTAIGGSAFGNYKCKTLATIEIPTSVTTIGGGAFTACEHLSWPDIPASVTKIGGCAFFGCDGFVDVVIPDTVTEFGESIFQACENLRSITSAYSSADKRCLIVDGVLNSFAFAGLGDTYVFPDNITSIGDSALRNNWYSGNLVIGDNVTRIEIEAFAYMSYIKSIRIGNNVSYIGSSAFRCFGYKPRVELELPASLTSVGVDVFTCYLSKLTIHAVVPPTSWGAILSDDDSLNPVEPYPIYVPAQSVEAYKTDQYWGAYADRIQAIPNAQPNNEIWYASTDGNIVVPNNSNLFGATLLSNTYKDGKGVMSFDGPVTMVGDKSYSSSSDAPFNYCRNLYSISLPESVEMIGSFAFYGCGSLQTVKMPSHLVYLGDDPFDSTDIRTINIPETDDITSGNPVGSYCYNLEEITGPYASIDHRCLIIENSIRAFAPAGLDFYTIEEGITEIGHGAFWGCQKGPKLIVFPSTLKVISNQSFIQCSMETLVFPEGLERIGYAAFSGCSSLISVTLPSTLSYLESNIFDNCTSLCSFSGKYASADGRLLVVNGSVKAFAQGCLTEYTIPEGITYATDGFDGYENLPSLESLTLPSTLCTLALRGKAITTLTSLATTPPSVSSSYYLYLPKVEAIYVPAGSIDAYKTASYWSSYADRIQAIPTSAGGGNEGTSEEAWN